MGEPPPPYEEPPQWYTRIDCAGVCLTWLPVLCGIVSEVFGVGMDDEGGWLVWYPAVVWFVLAVLGSILVLYMKALKTGAQNTAPHRGLYQWFVLCGMVAGGSAAYNVSVICPEHIERCFVPTRHASLLLVSLPWCAGLCAYFLQGIGAKLTEEQQETGAVNSNA